MSPLERSTLLALVSLIRDRAPDSDEWTSTDVKLSEVYERCYRLDPAASWERQRTYQRQSMRRALQRLHDDGYVFATALAWVNVADEAILRWQGGGSRKTDPDGYRHDTPRWRVVGLTRDGLALATLLEATDGGVT